MYYVKDDNVIQCFINLFKIEAEYAIGMQQAVG